MTTIVLLFSAVVSGAWPPAWTCTAPYLNDPCHVAQLHGTDCYTQAAADYNHCLNECDTWCVNATPEATSQCYDDCGTNYAELYSSCNSCPGGDDGGGGSEEPAGECSIPCGAVCPAFCMSCVCYTL